MVASKGITLSNHQNIYVLASRQPSAGDGKTGIDVRGVHCYFLISVVEEFPSNDDAEVVVC